MNYFQTIGIRGATVEQTFQDTTRSDVPVAKLILIYYRIHTFSRLLAPSVVGITQTARTVFVTASMKGNVNVSYDGTGMVTQRNYYVPFDIVSIPTLPAFTRDWDAVLRSVRSESRYFERFAYFVAGYLGGLAVPFTLCPFTLRRFVRHSLE